MDLLISILRMLVEVAGLALLGQGALHVLAGARRDDNAIYQLLRLIASPPVRAMRAALPRAISDRHIPVVTFFVLLWAWLGLAFLRQTL
ncbi:MAG: hypothetical protein REI94_08600 [Moraxellaceae bacterium]|nr:hypothetical protein [Moraxellaceae bacterium]